MAYLQYWVCWVAVTGVMWEVRRSNRSEQLVLVEWRDAAKHP